MIEIDVIGTMFHPRVDPENAAEVPPPLPGWHVNTTSDGLITRPDLAPFVVAPSRLRQVWAGDDPEAPDVTVALRFTDEAEANTALGL